MLRGRSPHYQSKGANMYSNPLSVVSYCAASGRTSRTVCHEMAGFFKGLSSPRRRHCGLRSAHGVISRGWYRALHHCFTTLDVHRTNRAWATAPGTLDFVVIVAATFDGPVVTVEKRLGGITIGHCLRHVCLRSVDIIRCSAVRCGSIVAHDIVERASTLLHTR